jgi:hypothetical protein
VAYNFTSVPVQAKLKVNTPGDAYEQEADRVADQMDSCACGGSCSSCSSPRVQRMSGAPAPESADVDDVLRGPSRPLDPRTRSSMESYFGHDFSGVRVHADSTAAASAGSLGARAYTVGHHLIFGPGEYRPGTSAGERLLAHELTHVTQQNAARPMIQREIKHGPASGTPELDVQKVDPKKAPACACLVFMHHSEGNARRAAKAMYDSCHYNLAIVSPATGDRTIDVRNVGPKDPNELFPRHIFRECVSDDAPCQNFLDANKGATTKAKSLEYAQRQFFLAIKDCSNKFSLPIVALHNNVVTDTANYHKQKGGKPLDEIRGKTFQDEGPLEKDARAYKDLETWLETNFPDLVKERDPAAKKEKDRPSWKKRIESEKEKDLLSGGMTNIFKWCQAHDNSFCYVGDPDHPDDVVWVTRRKDFDELRLKAPKANVALQTRVTTGESETDLSSMFVGDFDDDVMDRLSRERSTSGPVSIPPYRGKTLEWLSEWYEAVRKRIETAEQAERLTTAMRQAVQFVNIEGPQTPGTPAQRLANYRNVKTILQPLGLHCCDATEDAAVEAILDPSTKAPAKKP